MSVNFFLVSGIETTFLGQSGPNLCEVFMGTRSWINSIMNEIRPVTPELLALKIAIFNLDRAIETTFLNQSGPKLYIVFIGTRSQMSSIISEIHLVTCK